MEHEHEWGEVEFARMTGNPHRKCTVEGCRAVSLDLEDGETVTPCPARLGNGDICGEDVPAWAPTRYCGDHEQGKPERSR